MKPAVKISRAISAELVVYEARNEIAYSFRYQPGSDEVERLTRCEDYEVCLSVCLD